MGRKILSNLFWAFAFLCLVILANSEQSETEQSDVEENDSRSSSRQSHSSNDESTQSLSQKLEDSSDSEKVFYKAYQSVFRFKDPEKRLSAIERALKIAEDIQFKGKRELRKLHAVAANIHQDRWHYHFAIDSLVKAQTVSFEKQTDLRLKRLREHLGKVEKERHFNSDYIATRGTGPAKKFSGKVLVNYIFIDDGIKTRWSKKTLQRTYQVLDSVESWHKEQSKNYGVDNLSFENKFFTVKRNPRIKQLSSVSLGSKNENIEKYISAVMQSLGESSLASFIQKQISKHNADQGVVIFHSNFNQRSFARRCGYTHQRTRVVNGVKEVELISRCKEEFVMLMNKVERNRWDKLHYTQAHEMLHLFGADDLYNIRGAANFALTDIMNFQSKRLSDSQIDPITAYAIGWQHDKPIAPFNILEK